MDAKQIAEIFDAEFGFVFKFLDKVVKHINLDKESKILDIGTGVGRMSITLALNGYSVLTGEPDFDESEYAKQDWLNNAKKVNVDHMITFQSFNAEKMPFDNNSFDAIYIQGALHHIEDKASAFNESVRVMKKGGILCIFEPTPFGIKQIRKKFATHPDAIDPMEYAKDHNLSVEKMEGTVFNAFIFRKS